MYHYFIAFILKLRVSLLTIHLRSRGIQCCVQAQFRHPGIAHRWSTSSSILNGKISLGTLRRLQKGRDLDGNLWFLAEWAAGASDEALANRFPALVANAKKLGPTEAVYAEEGYSADDPRRLPNLLNIPVSKHVGGTAIDLNVDWSKLYGPWSEEANAVMERFGLCRPVPEECWHIELHNSRGMGISLPELFGDLYRYLFFRVAGE